MERILKAVVWIVMLIFMFLSLGVLSSYALNVAGSLPSASLTYSGIIFLPWIMFFIVLFVGGIWAFKKES